MNNESRFVLYETTFFVILQYMGRILAIDYGRKRCGIAATDPLKIAANGLPTVPTHQLLDFISNYCAKEEVELIIVGLPKQLDGRPSESERDIAPFIKKLQKRISQIPIIRHDERFTSTIAHREMIIGGFRKSKREEKGFTDMMAATIILTDYLNSRH